MLIDDEWNSLADLLANLIAKYASKLGIDDMPNPSHNKEYGSNSKAPEPPNRTFVVSENR
ncbi:hypothetical protein [Neglectibacter timonensis]|uniref:hypothetical protein n=1 Tax=Neglectibacter timonensis TaxID=1776382 RepID=UPI0023F0AE83|nr:hypothetical protein [Neglectibacter timonensis]